MHKRPCQSGCALNEMELVRRAEAGDTAAFDLLCEQYMPVLQGRAGRYSSIVGVDVEDFVQEGMLALYRAVKGFDPDAGIQFRTYAVTCINNSMASAIKSHMKNFSRRGGIQIDEMDEQTLHRQTMLLADDMLVEDLFIQKEMNTQRQRQIEILLSDFERQVLVLYLSGQSYQEIANVLSTTTKAVDNALQRVRRKLRPEP